MTTTHEKRDPDEVVIYSNHPAGVGGAGRIPVIGRVGNRAQPADDGEPRELAQAEQAEAGLLDLDDEGDDERPEHEPYDFSIGASIRSNAMAWRQLSELKGAIVASPASAGRDHALKLIDLFDSWFESGDDRLHLMLERRVKSGGEL